MIKALVAVAAVVLSSAALAENKVESPTEAQKQSHYNGNVDAAIFWYQFHMISGIVNSFDHKLSQMENDPNKVVFTYGEVMAQMAEVEKEVGAAWSQYEVAFGKNDEKMWYPPFGEIRDIMSTWESRIEALFSGK